MTIERGSGFAGTRKPVKIDESPSPPEPHNLRVEARHLYMEKGGSHSQTKSLCGEDKLGSYSASTYLPLDGEQVQDAGPGIGFYVNAPSQHTASLGQKKRALFAQDFEPVVIDWISSV
jgi:hypothetical protein